MNILFKKWIRLAVLIVVAWMYIGGAQPVCAEEISNARMINVDEEIYDSLSDREDEKYYQITTTQDGCLTIYLSHPQQRDSRTYWRVCLLDETYHQICSGGFSGNYETQHLPSMGLPAGTYYIKVDCNFYSGDMYTLNVGFQPSDVWEKEFNDEFLNASNMELNTDYYGTLKDDDDKDYYKMQLKEAGCLTVYLSHPQQGDGKTYWRVYLYDETYHQICHREFYGNYEKHRLPAIGLPAGTYYIKVDCNFYSGDMYTLNAGFKPSSVWEKEPDDEFLNASDIALNTVYYGTMKYSDDKDYYKLQILSDGYFRITIQTPVQSDNKIYWRVALYNTSYQQLTETVVYGNYTKHYLSHYLPAGTYYINVVDYNNYSSDPYGLSVAKWNPEPSIVKNSKPEITYITSGRKYLSVQFSSVDVAGVKYQISYTNKGKNWKNKTVNSASGKIKNLKSGKVYSVRVRAFKKINGKVYYGKWSDIHKITVK